jgi:chemotaxis methyl-accepting protein methylase
VKRIDELLKVIMDRRGIDFSTYRNSTLRRRIEYRMKSRRLGEDEYLEFIKRDAREINELIGVLTIKVSNFFRNPQVYKILGDTVIPGIASRKDEIFIWSAGCARGEEPYSISILCKEFKKESRSDMKSVIYASDIDQGIIEQAREAVYPEEAVRQVPRKHLLKYFIEEPKITAGHARGIEYRLDRGAKADIFFDVVDLTGSLEKIPFQYFDIILCRNVLIYYDAAKQQRILTNLKAHLSKTGYLILGEYETVHKALREEFVEVDPHSKIFRAEQK